MSNTIAIKGMAYASLDTASLAALYHQHSTPSRCVLPRDFMINSLLIRDFGQDAIDNHVADLSNQYDKYISNLTESISKK